MDMQDKEFDELFHSQLDGLEVQPSAAVWENIVSELPPKKRNKWVLLLSIAASVMVLVTAGLFFVPKKEVIKKGDVSKPGITKSKPVKDSVISNKTMPVMPPPIVASHVAVNQVAATKTTKPAVKTIAGHTLNALCNAGPPQAGEQRQIAATGPNQNILIAVVPDVAIQPANQQPDEHPVAAVPVALAANPKPDETRQTTPLGKRHRINSLGGLLNVVIAAIDKRKDKVVEFSESDDGDESNITAVNLGIIKVKKDK